MHGVVETEGLPIGEKNRSLGVSGTFCWAKVRVRLLTPSGLGSACGSRERM
jgi:hypothetical protein